MKKTVAIIGTLDTKGREIKFIKEAFEDLGINTFTINTGVFKPLFQPDVDNFTLAQAAGDDLNEIIETKDRGRGMKTLAKGVELIIPKLYEEDKFQGIISLGGSGGTALATAGMKKLPIGVPKIVVSTMASGDVEHYVGTSDIIMIPSIVDVEGLNEISKKIFLNAVNAMAGMLNQKEIIDNDKKPMIAASMFGVTTPCVHRAEEFLGSQGYEVLVFHATGAGGKTMESLVESGYFAGVLDITTTELCDELVGGVLSAGPNRAEAAALKGIPQVVSVGAMNMVNFGPMEKVPEKFKDRHFYPHNPTVTLMRTTKEENIKLGKILAEKLNKSKDKTKTILYLPLGGVSMLDADGADFNDPEIRSVLYSAIKENLDPEIKVVEMDNNINDDEFALAAAKALLELIEVK